MKRHKKNSFFGGIPRKIELKLGLDVTPHNLTEFRQSMSSRKRGIPQKIEQYDFEGNETHRGIPHNLTEFRQIMSS